jgi:hypothetical protein
MWCVACCVNIQGCWDYLWKHKFFCCCCLCLLPAACTQDFIFVGQGATATNFGVVPDKQANGCCASDHKPIVAEVAF